MIEIVNIEFKERPAAVGDADAPRHRSLIFWVRLPDDTAVRFLADSQAIRMLDAPTAKGAIFRRHVEKIVIRRHSPTIFSVVVFIRREGAERARSRLMAMIQAASPIYPEEIGTSLQGFDACQVAQWLESLGYHVELIAVAPAQSPTPR